MRCDICDYTPTECKSDYFRGVVSKGGHRYMVTRQSVCLCSDCFNMIKSDLDWGS